MGTRGPQPKNPARRQRRNAGSTLEAVSSFPVETPEPPKGILKATREAWDDFWSSDLCRAVESQDRHSLERLFLMRDEWLRCQRAVKRDPLVDGSQGQPVLNPLARRMDALQSEIRQLEDRFGLNPSARARLNVSFGDAQRSIHDLARRVYGDDGDDGPILVSSEFGDRHAASD